MTAGAMAKLYLNRETGTLYDSDARMFDAHARAWRRVPARADGGAETNPHDAARWLQRESGHPVRAPISVIGPREATPAQAEIAERLGAGLAGLGAAVLCGGLSGVMTAAAKGAAEAGGVVIGLLPENDWRAANPYVTYAIATGIGLSRNAVVAEAGLCIFAVGGGYGTLSEIAYGLQFGRRVYTLLDAPHAEGAQTLESVDAALDAAAAALLNLDSRESSWR